MMNTAPPFSYTMYGKRQRLPSPAAAPTEARMKNHFDCQREECVVMQFSISGADTVRN